MLFSGNSMVILQILMAPTSETRLHLNMQEVVLGSRGTTCHSFYSAEASDKPLGPSSILRCHRRKLEMNA